MSDDFHTVSSTPVTFTMDVELVPTKFQLEYTYGYTLDHTLAKVVTGAGGAV